MAPLRGLKAGRQRLAIPTFHDRQDGLDSPPLPVRGNDGDADQTVTYTYKGGKSGDYTKVTSDDYTDDGIPESIVTQEYSLDKKGRPVSVTSTYDMDANGIPERGYIDQYTYDKQGRVTQYVLTSEEDGKVLVHRGGVERVGRPGAAL